MTYYKVHGHFSKNQPYGILVGTAGFLCECDGRTFVLESRPTIEGFIKRRRKCAACAKITWTVEIPVEDLP
jgi:hypothetical protein